MRNINQIGGNINVNPLNGKTHLKANFESTVTVCGKPTYRLRTVTPENAREVTCLKCKVKSVT